MHNERRNFDRFQTFFPAKFKDTRSDFGNEVSLRDASANGFNIFSKERLYFNDRITLEVKLPDGDDHLVLNGKVIWSRPAHESSTWDVGLELDEINFMIMQRIFKYSLTP